MHGNMSSTWNYSADVFFMCETNDRHWVATSAERYEKEHSITCFFPERDEVGGRHKVDNLIEFLKSSRKIVPVLSNSFIHNYECDYALKQAIVQDNTRGGNTIIPIYLDDCSIPTCLSHINCLDARKQDFENRFLKAIDPGSRTQININEIKDDTADLDPEPHIPKSRRSVKKMVESIEHGELNCSHKNDECRKSNDECANITSSNERNYVNTGHVVRRKKSTADNATNSEKDVSRRQGMVLLDECHIQVYLSSCKYVMDKTTQTGASLQRLSRDQARASFTIGPMRGRCYAFSGKRPSYLMHKLTAI